MQQAPGCGFCRSTLGLKILMALTGMILFGFVLGHVTGNLLVFAGRDKLNAYSEFLHNSKGLLWGTRAVLLISVIVHIWASIKLTKLKADARPVPYASKEPHGSTYAARTMMWSGPIVAIFVVYHLLHFTTGTVHPDFRADVYHNVVTGFLRWPVSAAYVVAMLALSLHLSHGVWSMLQTTGINNPRWECALRRVAWVFAAVVTAGFVSIPLAVLFGVVH